MYFRPFETPTPEQDLEYSPSTGLMDLFAAELSSSFRATDVAKGIRETSIIEQEDEVYGVSEAPPPKDLRDAMEQLLSPRTSSYRNKFVKHLTPEEQRKSKHWRKGMKPQKGMSLVRLREYAATHDAEMQDKKVAQQVEDGILPTTTSFLAGVIGAIPDRSNLIALGGTGLPLLTRMGIGAVEGAVGQAISTHNTLKQREEIGIAPTPEERMQEILFAGIAGSILPALGEGFSKTFTKAAKIVKKADGTTEAVVVDEHPNVQNMTEKAMEQVPTETKAKVVNAMVESFEDPDLMAPKTVVEDPMMPNSERVDADPQEKAMSKAFTDDPVAARKYLEASGIPVTDKSLAALAPNALDEQAVKTKTLAERSDDIRSMSQEERYQVSDDFDVDISDVNVPKEEAGEYDLLQGDTLFGVVREKVEALREGMTEAISLVSKQNCK